jgi:4-hydroxy-2-oxoglutarate aldolase
MGGSADFVIQTLAVGGHGVIAGLANIAPRASLQVMELFLHGKAEEARETEAIVAKGD